MKKDLPPSRYLALALPLLLPCLGSVPMTVLCAVLCLSCCISRSIGQEPAAPDPSRNPVPLHVRIDQLCDPTVPSMIASHVEDGLFLRRLSLDLRNTVPTADELKLFVDDPNPNKRSLWIDRFLDDPLFAERMVTWFDLTFMERRNAQNVPRQAWLDYLRQQVDVATPIDQLARSLIASPWWSKEARAEQRFFLDRGGDPHLITRDFGRIFLGRDLQCAQCHDHPLVDDYLQRDYQGMLAFFAPSSLVEVSFKDAEGKDAKLQVYAEKASADASFESVFVKGKPHWAGPTLLDRQQVLEKFLSPADRYQGLAIDWAIGDPPKKPQQSRRSLLVNELLSENYRPFSENWANRIWAMLFGSGLVHPLDMHHANNPASHPALLQELTDAFVRDRYDYRKLIREIALSETYQRAHWLPMETGLATAESISKDSLSMQLTQAQKDHDRLIEDSELAETKWKEAQQAFEATEAEHVRWRAELAKVDATWIEANKKTNELMVAQRSAMKSLQDAQQKQILLSEAVQKLEQAKSLTIGDDPELSQSLQLAKQRTEANQASIPGLEVATTTASTNLEAQRAAEKTIQDQTLAVSASIDALQPAIATHHTAIATARDHWRSLERQRTDLERMMMEWQRLLQWREMQDAIQVAQSQLPTLDNQLVDVDKRLEVHRGQLSEAQRILDLSNSEIQKSSEVVTSLSTLLASKQSELTKLNDSKKQLEETRSLVNDPQSLQTAIVELDQSITARSTVMGQLQSDREAATQALAVATSHRDQLQSSHESMVVAIQQAEQEKLAIQSSIVDHRRTMADLLAKSDSQWQQIVDDRHRHLEASRLRALSAEQFCWSILRVTGILDQWVANQLAELDKAQPLPVDMPIDDQIKQDRYRVALRKAIDALRGNADQFANLFAAGAGQVDSFFASAEQALFLANGGSVHSWAGPSGNNVTTRVAQNADRDAAVEDLYWTLLCRKPTAEERDLVKSHLNVAPELTLARSQEAVWALLTSLEFRFVQ